MKNAFLLKFFFLLFGVFFFLSVGQAYAAPATLAAVPSSATKLRNEQFDVTIRVSSSTNFTVFKGTVSLNNLAVVSFTNNAGDALWITTPSATSLNFNGAVKGTTGVTSINVYTIRVRGINTGNASVNVSGGLVIGTESLSDLGTLYSNGSYAIINAPGGGGGGGGGAPAGQVQGLSTSITPVCSCTDKSCGDNGCGVSCGTCLTGFACSTAFSCGKDVNFDQQAFIASWNSLPNTEFIDINLGFNPADILVGPDGYSLSGFYFYGKTNPNSLVNLYIFGEPFVKSAKSDANGDWSVTVTESLPTGNYKVYAVKIVDGVVTKNSSVLSFYVDFPTMKVGMGTLEGYYSQMISPTPQVLGATNDACKSLTLPEEVANCNKCYSDCPTCTYSSLTCMQPTNNLGLCLGLIAVLLVGGGVILFIVYKKKKKQTVQKT